MKNDFDRPQPRGQHELENVAAESLGVAGPGKLHSPRFHRMSISSAENGYSVEHTTEDEPSDSDRNRDTSDPQAQGPHHKSTTHLVTPSHPAYAHVHSMHEAFMRERGGGNPNTKRGPQAHD